MKIAPNAKLAGYKVSDVDIVVAGVFAKPRYFVPRKALHDQDGKRLGGIKVKVENRVVAGEVKGHDAGGLNVAGDEVTVRYQEGRKAGRALPAKTSIRSTRWPSTLNTSISPPG